MNPTMAPAGQAPVFRHIAMMYSGEAGFMSGSLEFIREGIRRDESILVVVGGAKIAALRGALGPDAASVQFADMAQVGENPSRIIPAWQEFVDASSAAGRGYRGIGEPIDAGRSPAELAECHVHEALLNVAFGGSPAWELLCPYDVTVLPEAVLDEARRNHPVVVDGGVVVTEHRCRPDMTALLGDPLPEPERDAVLAEFVFDDATLPELRDLVHHHAQGTTSISRIDDFVLATYETAANSVRHGGGRGLLRVFAVDDGLVAEVRDSGQITDPLVGRARPMLDQDSGRGLWIANQLVDLLQLRVSRAGNVVRLHLRRTEV
ncbi:MAG: hypothetical protein JWL73_2058 [Actinomycetia bacterium]|nr:hypothetical protein [Actinomycetes bacterium]